MATLEQIVDDFNQVFGDIDWGDPDTVRSQIRQVVSKLQESDEVRDSVLNNDEDMQMQVIHDNISTELGIITANSSEMQRRYLSQPNIQSQLDTLILMRLQELINPAFNEQLLTEKLLEEFAAEFKELCGVKYRQLEEVIQWMFKVFDTETVRSLDGIKDIKRTLNLAYRTSGRDEDLRDWLKLLSIKLEAFMKKIYFMVNGKELTKDDGSFVQFLDTAKAVRLNLLYYTEDEILFNMKSYYNFLHSLRNVDAHNAPIIEDSNVRPGIHMVTAIYLYVTMINITDMESGENNN